MHPSTTILAYSVEGHLRDISVKLFKNWSIGLGADIISKFSIFSFFDREPSRQHSCEV